MKKLILILAVINLSGTKPGKKKEEYPVVIEFDGVKIKHHHSLSSTMLDLDRKKRLVEMHRIKHDSLEKALYFKRENWERNRINGK